MFSKSNAKQTASDASVPNRLLDPPKPKTSGEQADAKKSPNSKRRKSVKKSPLTKKKLGEKKESSSLSGGEPQQSLTASVSDVTPQTASFDASATGVDAPQAKFKSFFLSKDNTTPKTSHSGSDVTRRSDSADKSSSSSESLTREKVLPNTAAKLPPIGTNTPPGGTTPDAQDEKVASESSVSASRSSTTEQQQTTASDRSLLTWALRGDWSVVDQHMRNTSREKLEKVVEQHDQVSRLLSKLRPISLLPCYNLDTLLSYGGE